MLNGRVIDSNRLIVMYESCLICKNENVKKDVCKYFKFVNV